VVAVLAVKLLLAPSFVVGASLVGRRFGPRVGGLVGGLPVVAGPILLVYALAHGRSFAAGAAVGTLLGVVSLAAFVVVYGRLAPRLPWAASMLLGWVAFALATVAFTAVKIPAGVALGVAGVGLVVALAWLPRPGEGLRNDAPPPAWDLPLRAGCALALVLALTGVAGWLGPQLSGLLAPFPVITTVLAIFTHAQRGGLLNGFGAFALFCFVLAVSLPVLRTGPAFALASALAVLMQATIITLTQSGRLSRAS
jgi:hypothetical protein